MPGMGMPGAPSMPGMGMPGMPSMPGTGMPGAPSMPGMGMPGMPGMPGMDGMPGMPGMPGMETPEFAPPPDPYPNRIDVFTLASQKTPSKVVNPIIQSVPPGTIILSQNTVNTLGIWPNALAGWECPLTRSQGSARIKVGSVLDDQIGMSEQTKEDTNIKSDQVVVYSLEPPLVHQEAISLEVESKPDMNGFIQVSYRNAMSLQVTNGEIIAFEDSLTGASGAGKANISETVPDNKVFIDAELMESCGVNSYEVDLKKNLRQIIPLQSIELGIAPIKGENVWEVISMAKQNINSIKQWLGNYPIFKGIKLRWHAANVACEVLNTVPNLEGDVLASISPSTSLTLKPLGLVTFNAILVIDISRSMMARDVEVKNIGPALEGIKAAMHADEIQDFLKSFKPGTNVTRRHSAAFAGVLFLSEKVGRGFGEKVSIIRFADDAEVLKFPPNFLPYMDASSGEKGILEDCAKRIVNDIALAYGQATNMGKAMVKAEEVLAMYGNEQPTMIILLTDGAATDGDEFMKSISRISKNPNVVMYIIGLGNPDKETMKKAAYLLSGEYYEPADSGELLIWYSKRARDLQVKLKGQGSDA